MWLVIGIAGVAFATVVWALLIHFAEPMEEVLDLDDADWRDGAPGWSKPEDIADWQKFIDGLAG
jgi:hypothetical protein